MIYRGRFAPSPTGPLHAGSLVAALGSWLDARAHQGQWLVRIEDVDTPRCKPGATEEILRQLAALGLLPDATPVVQSNRLGPYQTALDSLLKRNLAYPCACSRSEIAAALQSQGVITPRHAEQVYPGTCRNGLRGSPVRAIRLRCPVNALNAPPAIEIPAQHAIVFENSCTYNPIIQWHDRRLGWQSQNVAQDVGDFVLRRADGCWAYQLAVVVDDAAQGITHVVRGEDLADNTPRQILLQRMLALPAPQYLHLPLVLAADGNKLSKQNGAQPLAVAEPLACLQSAGKVLGLQFDHTSASEWLNCATNAWKRLYLLTDRL